jgi:uncharacterized SAM-binding protein YcdF (DUF218 family)
MFGFFRKKYLFETRKTRFKRYWKKIIALFVFLALVYISLAFVLLIISSSETTEARNTFFDRSPDLIAVFTGDIGRIPFAIQKAMEYQNSKIFITGVYSKNTIEGLVRDWAKPDQGKEFNLDNIQIDYSASNTIENVISTLRYLRAHPEYKTVLVISSDYHIMRIRMIFNTIKMPVDSAVFRYMGIKTNYWQLRSIKILYSEIFKILKTGAFLLLWDEEAQIPEHDLLM